MKKHLTCTALLVLIVGIMLFFFWPYLSMAFMSSAHYREDDWPLYQALTPDILKGLPRISEHYEFSYTNVSGPQAYIYSVNFKGTSQGIEIRKYLYDHGYMPQSTCQVEAECWRSFSNNDVISLAEFPIENEIFVDIYRSLSTLPLVPHQDRISHPH